MLLDDALDGASHGRRGADERVPRLRRREKVLSQRADDGGRGDGVGHAAEAVVALAAESPVPCLLVKPRCRPEDGAGRPQGLPVQWAGPDHLAPGAIELSGQCTEVVEVRARVGEPEQAVRAAVLDEALQETRTGGLPAHDGLPVDAEPVGVVAQRAVRSGAVRTRRHSRSGPAGAAPGTCMALRPDAVAERDARGCASSSVISSAPRT